MRIVCELIHFYARFFSDPSLPFLIMCVHFFFLIFCHVILFSHAIELGDFYIYLAILLWRSIKFLHHKYHKYYDMEVGQNWNLFKIIWFLHHLKALSETNSEWAHFKNLAKVFQRYLHFSAQKNGFFETRLKRELTYLRWHQKDFLQFSRNKHSQLCQKWPRFWK